MDAVFGWAVHADDMFGDSHEVIYHYVLLSNGTLLVFNTDGSEA